MSTLPNQKPQLFPRKEKAMNKLFAIVGPSFLTLLVGGCGTSGTGFQYQSWSGSRMHGHHNPSFSSGGTGVSFFNGTTVSHYGSPPSGKGYEPKGTYENRVEGHGVAGFQATGTFGGKHYDNYYRRQDELFSSGGYATQSTTTRSWGIPGNRAYSSGTVTNSVTYYPPTEDRSFGRAVRSLNDIGEALFGKPNRD